jgi:dynactin-6
MSEEAEIAPSGRQAPQLTIHPGALVCEDLVVEGEYSVTIGPGTVVQPRCRILALGGPVVIGGNNILEERVVIE